MAYRADIAVYDSEGHLALIVEAKTKPGASPEWAQSLRQNLSVYGIGGKAKYFMLALPDRIYLWDQSQHDSADAPPDYTARDVFSEYFSRADICPETVHISTFEFIVVSWLYDILRYQDIPDDIREEQPWLIDSGLFDALQGGQIREEAEV